MHKCKMTPYEGTEPYIFISYAHKDSEKVFPILDELADRGYRIWYDAGIAPGSEWPEYIAEHLNNSEVVMAFVSPNSIASSNCRREVTFALSKRKNFIGVIIEPTEMSLGMEMQLSAQQCVMKYNYSTDQEFYTKLCETPDLAPCKVEKKVAAPVAAPEKVPAAETPAPVVTPTRPVAESVPSPISDDDMRAVEKMEKLPEGAYEKKLKAQKRKKFLMIGGAAVGALVLLLIISAVVKSAGTIVLSNGTKIDPKLSSVYIREVTLTEDQLSKIGKMEKLTSITMKDCVVEGNLADMANIGAIKYLDLEGTTLNSYAFLSKAPKLIKLNLEGGNLNDTDAQALKSLGDLTDLNLIDNTSFTDVSAIPTAKLTSLKLDGTGITSLGNIGDCESLRILTFSFTKVSDLGSSFNALRMEELEMMGLENVKDLSIFSNLTQLTKLKVAGCQATNIAWIEQCKDSLTILDVSGLTLDNETIEAIGKCTKLHRLYVNAVPLANLDFVKGMADLQYLGANECGLSDVSGLSGLTKLVWVWLSSNNLSSVDLSKAEKLDELNLAHNKIKDLSNVKNVKNLAIYDNPVDYSTIPDSCDYGSLMADYDEALMDKNSMAAYDKYYILNTPANKQVDLEDLYVYIYKTVTAEQLEQWIWSTYSIYYINWPRE